MARFLTLHDAIQEAAELWFPSESVPAPQDAAASGTDPIAAALLQSGERERRLTKIAEQTVTRVWEMLGDEIFAAVYFDQFNEMRQLLPQRWQSPPSFGDVVDGKIWPYGRPPRYFDDRPSYVLYVDADAFRKVLRADDERNKPRAKLSVETLRVYLLSIADGRKTVDECKALAEQHFQGKIPDKNIWRPAWGSLPPKRRRPTGRTRRNDKM